VQHATQVDVDHRRPAVDVEIGCRPDLADAGIADEYVKAAELLHGGVNQPLDVSAVCHIGCDGQCGAARGTNLVGQPAQSILAARTQDDGRATSGQQPRRRGADTTAGAGDRDDRPGQG
jgi:hypothetical protein